MPEVWPVPLVVERSGQFIREKAILKVAPVARSKVKNHAKGNAIVMMVEDRLAIVND